MIIVGVLVMTVLPVLIRMRTIIVISSAPVMIDMVVTIFIVMIIDVITVLLTTHVILTSAFVPGFLLATSYRFLVGNKQIYYIGIV